MLADMALLQGFLFPEKTIICSVVFKGIVPALLYKTWTILNPLKMLPWTFFFYMANHIT